MSSAEPSETTFNQRLQAIQKPINAYLDPEAQPTDSDSDGSPEDEILDRIPPNIEMLLSRRQNLSETIFINKMNLKDVKARKRTSEKELEKINLDNAAMASTASTKRFIIATSGKQITTLRNSIKVFSKQKKEADEKLKNVPKKWVKMFNERQKALEGSK